MNGNKVIFASVVVVVFLIVIAMVVAVAGKSGTGGKSLEKLVAGVDVTQADPVKASVELTNNSLFDEVPEITKYPLKVEGTGDVDIEIFTSGEKAGTGTDSWLIEVAEKFNQSGTVLDSGKSVSISVRSVSSGLAADYIASGKYLPDLYTPSNELFGEYCKANGGSITLYNERLVGNTAGVLVKKGSGYTDVESVIEDVREGNLNLGYTNPQTSATGLNLLLTILRTYDSNNMFSDTAVEAFADFNNNIPFVAYTTQQMRDSASNGSLDGMVSEYQAYINDTNLTASYDFIPFGERHDNPLYIVNATDKTADELKAIELINQYLMSDESQAIATKDGFNQNDDYASDVKASGSDVSKALEVYKLNKDGDRPIIAVFVADCSGSMNGEPMLALKESLTNGMQYINSNNYVGLVSFNDDVTIELPIAQFDLTQKSYFQGAVNRMSAGGGTASYDALTIAMDMIETAKADHPDAKCMIFLLSDGAVNRGYSLKTVTPALSDSKIPVYAIGYGDGVDKDELNAVAAVNEAATIYADSDDIIYQIKSLFNSNL
jgi:Ca-activated chloride channel family protein